MTRVLLIADMEGISGITDYRECWPVFTEYWETGRQKMMADIVAAAQGLTDGGATGVLLVNGHGFGYPNIDPSQLPEGCRLVSDDEETALIRSGEFDATFQIGRHARCGTQDGFMSHTQTPDFRIQIEGKIVTESHINGWRGNRPLLGIIGDAALESELDGALSGTPFMAVKQSQSRVETTPVHDSPATASAAIRAFAAWCVVNGDTREAPGLPDRFTFSCCLNGALADLAVDRYGLLRTSPSVLVKSCTDWWTDAEPALQAGMAASMQPWLRAWRGIDFSSREALDQQNPAALDRARTFIDEWMHRKETDWRR